MEEEARQQQSDRVIPGYVWLGLFLLFALWTIWRLGGFDIWTTVVTSDGQSVRFPNTFATVDHPFHATRAEVLRRSLADGELLRWVGNHQGGYPVEFYPLGAAWMEIAVWAATLGTLPMMAVHKLVVILVFLLPVAGFAALTRFGGLPWSVPLLAIVLHVSVRGWWWSGGYMELIEWGLLTNVASAAILPLVLALVRGYLRSPKPAYLISGAAMTSLSVYTNVRSVLPLAAILVGVVIASQLDVPRPSAAIVGRRVMWLGGLSLLLLAPLAVSLWRYEDLYVFVRYSSYATLTDYWNSSVQAVSSPVMVLALVGALFALLSKRDDGARTVLIVLALYAGGTALTVVSISAADLVSQLEATRLMPFQRLLVMYLAAYGVWRLADRAAATLHHPERSDRSPAVAVLPDATAVPGNEGEILRSAQDDRVAGVAMAAVMLLFLAGYIGGWMPGIPESDRATGTLFTTGNSAFVELRKAVELADEQAEPGTAVLVLGGVVSWHDQLWSPQWSDRRFFYDDWLWYWQTDHVGDYDPVTTHAYDNDISTLSDGYLAQHAIGAVVVTGEAAPAAAESSVLTELSEGTWSVFVAANPTAIMSAGDVALEDPSIGNQSLLGRATEPAMEFTVRHNWFPRWTATVDGRNAEITKNDAGYMRVTTNEPGSRLDLTYRVDVWDWLARIAFIAGLGVCAVLATPQSIKQRRLVARSG